MEAIDLFVAYFILGWCIQRLLLRNSPFINSFVDTQPDRTNALCGLIIFWPAVLLILVWKKLVQLWYN